jgi:hypothetical protein
MSNDGASGKRGVILHVHGIGRLRFNVHQLGSEKEKDKNEGLSLTKSFLNRQQSSNQWVSHSRFRHARVQVEQPRAPWL